MKEQNLTTPNQRRMLVKIGVPATAATATDENNDPCFTLQDLLSMLPKSIGQTQRLCITHDEHWCIAYGATIVGKGDNLINALVAAIFTIRCIQQDGLIVYIKQPNEK